MAQLQLVIEDGIPIPETTTRQGSNITLLKSMKPGQSVFFGTADVKKATRFYRVAKKIKVPIVIRKVEGGMRMWRVDGDCVLPGEQASDSVVKGALPGERPSETAMRLASIDRAHDKKAMKKTIKKLTDKQRREAKNAKDRERRRQKKIDAQFGRNV